MATHSGVLAWRIPGTAEPGGLPSLGSHRVGHDWNDLAAAAAAAAASAVSSSQCPAPVCLFLSLSLLATTNLLYTCEDSTYFLFPFLNDYFLNYFLLKYIWCAILYELQTYNIVQPVLLSICYVLGSMLSIHCLCHILFPVYVPNFAKCFLISGHKLHSPFPPMSFKIVALSEIGSTSHTFPSGEILVLLVLTKHSHEVFV